MGFVLENLAIGNSVEAWRKQAEVNALLCVIAYLCCKQDLGFGEAVEFVARL
jgi:hypothetical protein